MRILLASPESGVWNSRKHIHMGLGYLAGALRAAGHAVDIWDADVEAEVRRIMLSGVRDGGLFVLREGNNMAPETPIENLEAMVSVGRAMGSLKTDNGGSA